MNPDADNIKKSYVIKNKIIKSEDLMQIFEKMNEKLLECKSIYEKELAINEDLDNEHQKWTFKDNKSTLSFSFDFPDEVDIDYENFNIFKDVYNERINEIKNLRVTLDINYIMKDKTSKNYYQGVHMEMSENSLTINTSTEEDDPGRIGDLIDFILDKVNKSPKRYDRVIKNKVNILLTVGWAYAFIPSFIFTCLLLLSSTVRDIFASSLIVFPIVIIASSFILGILLAILLFNNTYNNITISDEDDNTDKEEVYCEVLFGKNTKNLINRKIIFDKYKKCKRLILPELIILGIVTILVVL